MDELITRRDAIAALASTAALPFMSACARERTAMHISDDRGRRGRAARRTGRKPAPPRSRRAPRRSASTPAHGRQLRSQLGRPLGGGTAARRRAAARGPRASERGRHVTGSRTPRAPASRSCEARMRRRSTASRSRTATSRLAAGATRPMSSSRTSAPISTSRASSTATIRSRTPPTPRRISRGCSPYAKQLDGELGRIQAARASRARAAGLPARQGADADAAVGEERARRRDARRVNRAADERDPGQLGRARARDRRAGDRAGARSADRGARGPARRRDGRRRHVGAAAAATNSTGGR